MDKINKLQDSIASVIDEISGNIQQVSLDGENNDMVIQKQIVSAGQLLDKVAKLKDQIDGGELDGQSNLGNILNSEISQQVTTSFSIDEHQPPKKKESRSSMFAIMSPFSKKKNVRRTMSSLNGSDSKSYMVDTRANQSFQISGSAEAKNEDSDE